MSDENSIEDIDLLSLFEDNDSTNSQDTNSVSSNDGVNIPLDDNEDTKTSFDTPKEVSNNNTSIFDMLGSSGNRGSGDINEDLMNWFVGVDKLPSDPLADFLSNSALKAEFGMMFNMIKNFERIKKLQDFVDKAEEVYFNPEDIITLDPEDLEKRMKFASDVMKNMYEMNRRTISSIKKKSDDGEMEKLKVLLSAIPNNKLKDIISSLSRT
jgi:hypothetical protein